MARGKYATRSEATKAREAAQEEAARLRRELERVTVERDELRETFAKARESYDQTERRLQMQVSEGTSSEVQRLTDRTHGLLREAALWRGKHDGLGHYFTKWQRAALDLLEEQGVQRKDALGRIRARAGMSPDPSGLIDPTNETQVGGVLISMEQRLGRTE